MNKDREVIYKLKCISVVSLIFMTVQILGGIMANSIAILADAFHLLSDVLAYVISLQAVLLSHKKPPFFMTFGYQKIQPLGALINVAIIWFVTLQLVIQATERIINKAVVEDPLYMLLTSFFGLGCNLYIMRVLHSDVQHGGHQGCSHAHGLQHHKQHHQHKHQHKDGEKCGHSHNQTKPQAIEQEYGRGLKKLKKPHKKSKNDSCHGHGHHKSHNHNHTHNHGHQGCSHNHDHHNHNHSSSQEDKGVQQKHDHKHEHNEHQGHDHGHHHHDGKCSHGHKHQKNGQNSYSPVDSVRQLNLQTSATQGQKLNSNSKLSLNQQINSHISYKLQSQMNLSDQNLSIAKKQQARKQLFRNINIQAAYIHIISDIILSIGVIISAIIIYCFANPKEWNAFQLADPICTYLFSVLAIYSTVGIAKDSAIMLLDGCDQPEMLKTIVEEIDGMDQIDQYQQLRVWSLNRSKFAAAIKIYLSKDKYENVHVRDEIKSKVTTLFAVRKIQHYIEVLQHVDQDQHLLKNE